MFKLVNLREGLYQLFFDDFVPLGMAFVRYQEFYESKCDKVREKSATLAELMAHYARTQHSDKNTNFTYPSDWGGYNLPASIIRDVHDAGISDLNFYDEFMHGVWGFINTDTDIPSYLIGTSRNSDEDDQAKYRGYMLHECTHAMFFIDEEYRNSCTKLIETAPVELKDQLTSALKKIGYPDKVIVDEIQAYITTGEGGHFDYVTVQEQFDELRSSLRELHRTSFPKFFPDFEEKIANE
jgi:hypothetical protein